MRIQTGQGTIPLITLIRYMVDLGTERAAGTGRFSYPGKAFGDISAFDGTGYTDVVVAAFPVDHTVHNPVREAD